MMKKIIKLGLNKTAKFIFWWAHKMPFFSPYTEGSAFLRTDNIGDYLLFRNLLPFIKQSEKYKNKKIILIGNSIWKELAEHFDSDFVDVFFWINMSKFKSNKIYRFKILWQLNQLKISELINTVHSKTLQINDLVEFTNAELKTTCAGDDVNLGNLLQIKSDNLFNQIIPSLSNSNFEFFRNKSFIEHLINEKIDLNKPYFNAIKKEINPTQIIIFPSTQSVFRHWKASNFSEVINALNAEFSGLNFLILGSKNDVDLGEFILRKCDNSLTVKNLCGQTSLVELVQIIANSRLLISNETSAVHIAAGVETPTICIANGERFMRFSPYPLSITHVITYIFPNNDFYKKEKEMGLTEKYKYASNFDINLIKSENVLLAIKKELNNK
jgi:ADP-heptose:LPS heptosyltransferase